MGKPLKKWVIVDSKLSSDHVRRYGINTYLRCRKKGIPSRTGKIITGSRAISARHLTSREKLRNWA